MTGQSNNSTELAKERTDWAEDRTLLAAERTFASWMRTGMGAVAVAIGLQAVFGETDPTWLAKVIASIFLVTALLVFWFARKQAKISTGRLSSNDATPQPRRHYDLLTVLFIAATLGVGVVLWII